MDDRQRRARLHVELDSTCAGATWAQGTSSVHDCGHWRAPVIPAGTACGDRHDNVTRPGWRERAYQPETLYMQHRHAAHTTTMFAGARLTRASGRRVRSGKVTRECQHSARSAIARSAVDRCSERGGLRHHSVKLRAHTRQSVQRGRRAAAIRGGGHGCRAARHKPGISKRRRPSGG